MKVIHRKSIDGTEDLNYYSTLSIAILSLIYFFTLPSSLTSYFFFVFFFIFLSFRCNYESLAFFLLFFGNLFLGHLLRGIGIKYVGFAVAVLVGLFLIFIASNTYKQYSQALRFNWYLPGGWILLTSCILFFAFGLGPQSTYSLGKLLIYHRTLILIIIAFTFLILNRKCDLWEIGVLLIVAATVIYAYNIYFYPDIRPDNILNPGGMRMKLKAVDSFFGDHFKRIGYFASMGAVCLICSIGDIKSLHFRRKLLFLLFLILSLIILNSTGQRLFIANVLIAAITIILWCKPKNKKFLLNLVFLLILIVFLIIIIGLYQENEFIEQVFKKNTTLGGRLNRAMWYDALQFIREKPFFGHGLGGYAEYGLGYYPHNLLLELLVETGIFGTITILIPLILLFFIPNIKNISTFRTARGQIIFPFLLTIFTYVLISGDLTNSSFFAVSAVYWAFCSTG